IMEVRSGIMGRTEIVFSRRGITFQEEMAKKFSDLRESITRSQAAFVVLRLIKIPVIFNKILLQPSLDIPSFVPRIPKQLYLDIFSSVGGSVPARFFNKLLPLFI